MKINKRPKAQMHAAGDSVDTAHCKEPEGRLEMRLYRRGHCLPASTPKSWPLPNVATLPMPTSGALCLPPLRAPSPVKSAHYCVVKACTHLHWRHGDANMRQVSSMEPTLKNVAPKLPLLVRSSGNWH